MIDLWELCKILRTVIRSFKIIESDSSKNYIYRLKILCRNFPFRFPTHSYRKMKSIISPCPLLQAGLRVLDTLGRFSAIFLREVIVISLLLSYWKGALTKWKNLLLRHWKLLQSRSLSLQELINNFIVASPASVSTLLNPIAFRMAKLNGVLADLSVVGLKMNFSSCPILGHLGERSLFFSTYFTWNRCFSFDDPDLELGRFVWLSLLSLMRQGRLWPNWDENHHRLNVMSDSTFPTSPLLKE